MFAFMLLLASALAGQSPAPAAKKPVPARSAAAKPATTTPASPKKPEPVTDEEKTIYALGLSIARSLATFELSPSELEIVKSALSDAASGKPAVDIGVWGPKIQSLAQVRGQKALEHQKALSQAYLDKAAAEPGAVKSETGLIYKELREGTGASPRATDTVKVNYRGTLVDGTEFDSSYKRNEPAQFALNAVIPCWTEGLQKMKVGGKARLCCPSQIAYGDGGRPSIPGGAALTFEIELLDIPAAGQ